MVRRDILFLAVVLAAFAIDGALSNPAIGYEVLGVCIRNCAQCKKMLGPWFEGQLCADACLKFKGKIVPDCEDIQSIQPFLNKLE